MMRLMQFGDESLYMKLCNCVQDINEENISCMVVDDDESLKEYLLIQHLLLFVAQVDCTKDLRRGS